ncbi:MAG TPA: maleylpyruvate isomerase N-terminal domain-containing protein [Ilumatobacteraceae bacterium]|nr:maleylpyruvate isomerase N-terminal domain-containing protein [Ilumatobacteraceae bacterium]
MTTEAVDAVRIIHGHFRHVLTNLSEDDWSKPSGCDGWRVQDMLAHVTSNQKEFVDPTPPPDEPAAAMTAEQAMESLVAPRKDWSVDELLAEYDRYTDAWFGVLDAMQQEPTASTMGPLADLGTYPMHMVANAFAFDHYCHLRVDLLQPTGPLDADVPGPTDEEVRPGIEWMIAGIPQMQPGVLPPVVTQPLGLRLTGPGGGEWTIRGGDIGGQPTLAVVDGIDADVAGTVESSAHDFVRWGTQRCDWRECCTVAGDADYLSVVLDTLNIV